MPLKCRSNVRVWLQADIQSLEIEVCLAPNSGRSWWGRQKILGAIDNQIAAAKADNNGETFTRWIVRSS